MPRDGSQVYVLPFPDVVEDTTIESTVYNGFTNDVAQDLNAPRPIIAGGTGATSGPAAMAALGGELSGQVVTNYDAHVFQAGSFYSAAGATSAPVIGHAFTGICFAADANNLFIEARDQDDTSQPGGVWVRQKKAGVWSSWARGAAPFSSATPPTDPSDNMLWWDPTIGKLFIYYNDGNSKQWVETVAVPDVDPTTFVEISGDTMTGPLVLSGPPTLDLHPATKKYTDDADAATLAAANAAAADAVKYTAQSLTSAQKEQARANIDALKKNYIINGGMQVSQQNGTAVGTVTGYHPADMFSTGSSLTGTYTVAQVIGYTPGGSPNRTRLTVTAADTSIAAGEYAALQTSIEGNRFADLKFGSASPKIVTLRFGVKAPAGIYSVSFRNAGNSRAYVGEYVISAGEANTEVVKTITFTGDATGSWSTDNTVGLNIVWALATGTTYQAAPGSWVAGNILGSTNQFNFFGTNGNVFELFDVGLYEGSAAPAFQVPDYATTLQECQRYYQTLKWQMEGYIQVAQLRLTTTMDLATPMRTTPSRVRLVTGAHANIRGGDPANFVLANAVDNQSVVLSMECAAQGFSQAMNFVESYSARI